LARVAIAIDEFVWVAIQFDYVISDGYKRRRQPLYLGITLGEF